jgi:hypothetical protein
MAIGNSVYGPVRADIEDGVVRLISDNLDCILVDSSLYTYSKETGGAESGKILVFYYDTATSGLPVTPNGGDITVQWAEGNFRIFAM